MAPNQQIVLFDLASKDGNKCWSHNPWKTRFVLNYKGLNYTTEFLEYPDLKTVLEPRFAEPKDKYTSPTIAYTDGRYIADSRVIAGVLEKDHPSPSLHLDSSYLARIEDIVQRLLYKDMPITRALFVAQIPLRLLNKASVPYWYRTRETSIGMKLDEYEATYGGDKAWAQTEQPLGEVTAMLTENEGPFFMGETLSYADFVWAGILIFFRRIGEDRFEELLKRTGDPTPHRSLLEAVEPWSRRDDH